MDGAPLAMMLARKATIDLAESGGPHGATVASTPRPRTRAARTLRAVLARRLHRLADVLEHQQDEVPACHPAR